VASSTANRAWRPRRARDRAEGAIGRREIGHAERAQIGDIFGRHGAPSSSPAKITGLFGFKLGDRSMIGGNLMLAVVASVWMIPG
jgi:hypothetical protein